MKKIAIDARESGTTSCRYIDKLIEYLHQLEPDYEIVVITKKPRVDFMKSIAPDFGVIASPYKEFGFDEQTTYSHTFVERFATVSLWKQPFLANTRW